MLLSEVVTFHERMGCSANWADQVIEEAFGLRVGDFGFCCLLRDSVMGRNRLEDGRLGFRVRKGEEALGDFVFSHVEK